MSDTLDHGDVVHHFTARAEIYDRSSHWCTSEDLMEKVVACAAPSLTITSWTWPAEPAS